jgi:mono/diheme cytochrome c family protein
MMPSGKFAPAALAAGILVACAAALAAEPSSGLSPELERGKYLVKIAGCNDCHTAGYLVTHGQVEESKWLMGDALGWSGPWGTTYAPNLRLTAERLSAAGFTELARSPLRPPMPYFNLREMKDEDVRAIYAYLKHLGPAGEPAPAALPPGEAPPGPYVKFPEPPPGK